MTTNNIAKCIVMMPIGQIAITASDTHLHGVELLFEGIEHDSRLQSLAIVQQIITQLNTYFTDAQQVEWSLPLAEQGTLFQRKVWQYLQTIPLGETRYYSDVAKALNSSAQAVGNACRANPFAIVVPCHRVVSKSGLGGYYGQTVGNNIGVKQWLLDHERK